MAGKKTLDKPRYERFAQNKAKGMLTGPAYTAAGFKATGNTAQVNGGLLLKRPEVKARIAEILSVAAERTVTTVDDIARQLDEDRKVAKKNSQASAMVQATMGKAKVLGLIVDKHLVGMKRVEDMNEHELRALLGVVGEPSASGS